MPKSTRRKQSCERPKKPYPAFPLTPHAGGKWQKKIRGRIHYFGRWGRMVDGKIERLPDDGWREALEAYQAVADDLHAGRTPRPKTDGLTVVDLCNRFLTVKLRAVEAGELTATTFAGYREVTDLLVSAFGRERLVDDLAADDFEVLRATMTERWGPVRMVSVISRTKGVFKYGFDAALLATPMRYGPTFRAPSRAVLRRHKASNGGKMLEAADIRKLLELADAQTKAWILLGCNAAFTGKDIADLPLDALDLDGGWVSFPRPKTGIGRKAKLWDETAEALRDWLAVRPKPAGKGAEGLVFLQPSGKPWLSGSITSPVCRVVRTLMETAGTYRPGKGFATLRHVFRTVADATHDRPAVDLMMGHTDPTMRRHYVERIDDSRLVAVAEHVHTWLFPTNQQQ